MGAVAGSGGTRSLVTRLLEQIGADPAVVDVAIADETTHDEIKAEHQKVADAGGFGVPTFFPDGQCLFGSVVLGPPRGEAALRLRDDRRLLDGLMQSSDRGRDTSYGDMVHAPRNVVESFEEALASNPAQDPQNAADAIVSLVETPAGERRFRTVVDNMGMAGPIEPFNDGAEQVTAGNFGAFGMAGLLAVNTRAR